MQEPCFLPLDLFIELASTSNTPDITSYLFPMKQDYPKRKANTDLSNLLFVAYLASCICLFKRALIMYGKSFRGSALFDKVPYLKMNKECCEENVDKHR